MYRQIPISRPFAGQWIQFFQVLSPSVPFFSELIQEFGDAKKIAQANTLYVPQPKTLEATLLAGVLDNSSLEDDPQDTPTNNTSTILATRDASGRLYLFTADAALSALKECARNWNTEGCYWMQMPHHGSRHNISPKMIEHFRPQIVFVSAKGGSGHPSRAVVNAFKKFGNVYSTHYPHEGNLSWIAGTASHPPGTGPAVPLWDADKETVAPNPWLATWGRPRVG